MKRHFVSCIIAAFWLPVLLCAGCLERRSNNPVGESSADAGGSAQVAAHDKGNYAQVSVAVGRYDKLNVGMNLSDIKTKLPEGMAFEDLEGPMRYETGTIDTYANVFPAEKMPLFNGSMFPESTEVYFQLSFVDNRLVRITLGIPPKYLKRNSKSKAAETLKSFYAVTTGDLKPDEPATEDRKAKLFWALQGSDGCVAKAGIAIKEGYFKGFLIVDMQDAEYDSYPNGKDGEDVTQSPAELARAKEYDKDLGGFAKLTIGMSKDDAMGNLPWALTYRDFKWTAKADNGSIEVFYGENVLIPEADRLGKAIQGDGDRFDFMLVFTPEGLGVIDIIFPTASLTNEEITALKSFMSATFGTGLYYLYQPQTPSETWVVFRRNAFAELSCPLGRSRENACLIIATEKASIAYGKYVEKSGRNRFSTNKN